MRPRTLVLAFSALASSLLLGPTAPVATAVAPTASSSLDVHISTTKHSLTMSTTAFTPGNTTFTLTGKGSVEIVSLRHGYTIDRLARDGRKLFSGDVATVRRVDRDVVFWGGAEVKGESSIGIDLPSGSYYAVDLDHQQATPFTVSGTPETRTLPGWSATVKYVGEMRYRAPARLDRGWIRFANHSDEPHFTDFAKLRPGTTKAQVRAFLASGAQGQPAFALAEHASALVASPGHSFVYDLGVSRGLYAELCFWPSDETGQPHALMGMFDLSKVR